MTEWKLRRWKKIELEGFEIHRLINLCSARGIGFRNLRMVDDCKAEAQIDGRSFDVLRKLAGNRYRVTVVGQLGLESRLRLLLSRTATCVGLACFCGIVYFQSCFISQVRISGYERLTEREIRETLEELGFYPGAVKSFDLADLKTRLYHELDNVTWVGISYEGTVAQVEVLEGSIVPSREDTSDPVHVVADRQGYLEELIVKEGIARKKPGDYIEEGEILISGIVPITDKSYTRKEEELIRYVHAQGEAKARVLHRATCYQPRYTVVLADTGRWIPGIRLRIGTQSWDSDRFVRPWASSRRDEVASLKTLRPIPVEIQLYRSREVTVTRAERLPEEVEARAEQQVRAMVKEILPKDGQLMKKDLSFLRKENIIEVNVLLHSLESIGRDQPFAAQNPSPAEEAPDPQ